MEFEGVSVWLVVIVAVISFASDRLPVKGLD